MTLHLTKDSTHPARVVAVSPNTRQLLIPLFAVLSSLLLMAALLLLAGKVEAESPAPNKYVAERIALMSSQKKALQDLTAMTRDYIAFDRSGARAARRALVRSTRRIPRHFRRDVTDLSSHARGGIWTNWADFKRHADDAEKAARALNTRSASGLRRSLPRLISACHNCHQIYRNTPREFTTH
ncbi:c-type cytochrome [Phaeobacter piscinae]|uniref:c-type cytochrome n=1 Tax=Phaeobacter piscinae TaxID=1580596 RepID=UPI000BBE2E50|nr:cytochrome c [Phaeobacter piscinae]ATG38226.1 Cytochrome c556 [Phaeobacter piscinae]